MRAVQKQLKNSHENTLCNWDTNCPLLVPISSISRKFYPTTTHTHKRQNSSTRWGFSLGSDKNTLCKRSTITFGMPLPLYKCHIFSAALINLCSLKSHKLWLEFRLRQKRCNNQLAKNDQSIQFLINKSTSDFALDKKVEYRITNKQKKTSRLLSFISLDQYINP